MTTGANCCRRSRCQCQNEECTAYGSRIAFAEPVIGRRFCADPLAHLSGTTLVQPPQP